MTRLTSLVLVVRTLERALAVYEQGLGFARLGDPEDVPSLGARHVLLRADNCTIELLEPHDDRMPPGIFLRARGEGVFAMELGTDDPAALRERLAQVSVEARGAETAARLFVRPNDAHGVLVEVGRTPPSA
jgi:hypothetical protein